MSVHSTPDRWEVIVKVWVIKGVWAPIFRSDGILRRKDALKVYGIIKRRLGSFLHRIELRRNTEEKRDMRPVAVRPRKLRLAQKR